MEESKDNSKADGEAFETVEIMESSSTVSIKRKAYKRKVPVEHHCLLCGSKDTFKKRSQHARNSHWQAITENDEQLEKRYFKHFVACK